MQTPSEQTRDLANGKRNAEWAARPAKPPRSVFGNYRAAGAPVSDPAGAEANHRRAGPETGAPLQASIDLAVARSFLYRLVAKAFEDPVRDGWIMLTAGPTQTGLLAAVAALAERNPALLQAGARWIDALNLLQFETFQSDYVSAFGHAARGTCPLNEIEYGDLKADPLFQPHRLADLAAFYRAFGLEVADDASERHDHICIELEFMPVLAAKAAYALEHQADEDQLEICGGAQKKFLREHLGRWVPTFARRLRDVAGDGPLATLADFARQFILDDCARFSVAPGGDDLLLRPVDEAAESMCASCGIAGLPPGAAALPAGS